jgi:hypothetical protein
VWRRIAGRCLWFCWRNIDVGRWSRLIGTVTTTLSAVDDEKDPECKLQHTTKTKTCDSSVPEAYISIAVTVVVVAIVIIGGASSIETVIICTEKPSADSEEYHCSDYDAYWPPF